MTYKGFYQVLSFVDKLHKVSFGMRADTDCLKNQLDDTRVSVDQLVSLPHFLEICLQLYLLLVVFDEVLSWI